MEKLDVVIPKEIPHWQLFAHGSDIGVRGFGTSMKEAFEQVAIALTGMVTEPHLVKAKEAVKIACGAPEPDLLLLDWLNALIYEMSTRNMLFIRFEVKIEDHALEATIWGEKLDKERHQPAVEPKGATFTQLKIEKLPEGIWIAQDIIDV